MMATMVLATSGNLIRSSDQFPTVSRMEIKKNTSVVGFRGQPPHIGGVLISRQAQPDFPVYCLLPGSHPPPIDDSQGLWQQWIFGLVATVVVPFFTRKWTNLLKIKDEVDTVVKETEKIVDYVEEVAETVDKVAKDVADHLPEGGKWRNAAVFVEGVAEEIAKDAHLVEDFLHEVEEVEEKVELLVESVEDQTKNVRKDLITS